MTRSTAAPKTGRGRVAWRTVAAGCRASRALTCSSQAGGHGEDAGRRPAPDGGAAVVGQVGAVADDRRAGLGEPGPLAAQMCRPECRDRVETGRRGHRSLHARAKLRF
jgi:hypothetical protein